MASGPKQALPKDFFRDGKSRPLKFGNSFLDESNNEFMSIMYDFKPPSSDNTQTTLEIGSDNNVNISVRQETDEVTTYKGCAQEPSKDCFLIIDHDTGEIVLERVSSVIRVKRTRELNSSRQRPTTPQGSSRHHQNSSVPESMPGLSSSDDSMDEDESERRIALPDAPPQKQVPTNVRGSNLSSSSSSGSSGSSDSGSDSDSDDDGNQNTAAKPRPAPMPRDSGISKVLINDLELSSGSDDD